MPNLQIDTEPETVRPRVSVIVPIRNEERYIAGTLQQLVQQEHDGIELEILVVDGCSTDGTRQIVSRFAKQHPKIRLLENPRLWSSSARNIGIAGARGDFVVVIDGHCEIPTSTYILDLVDAFERTKADCLGRPQPLDVTGATNLQRAIAVARSSWLGHHPESFIYSRQEKRVRALTVAVAYRKDVFTKVGCFDESFDACEDCELNYRIDEAGLTCYLIPKLTIKYKPRTSLSGLFRQLVRYGQGRLRLYRKHPRSFSFFSILPAVFVLWLFGGLLMSLLVAGSWPVYLGVMAVYCMAILAVSSYLAVVARDWGSALWLPLVFFTIHASTGAGVILEFFSGLSKRSKPRNS